MTASAHPQRDQKKTSDRRLRTILKSSPLREVLSHVALFALNATIAFWTCSKETSFKEDQQQLFNTSNLVNGTIVMDRNITGESQMMGWITVGLWIVLKLSSELQKVYMILGLVRSPFYTDGSNQPLAKKVVLSIRSLLFNFCLGLILTYTLKCVIVNDIILAVDPMPYWFEAMAIIRITRWAWQNSECALAEVAGLHLALTAVGSRAAPDNFILHSFFNVASRPVQLLLIGLLRDRLKQIVEKTFFVLTLSVSSLDNRSSRKSYAGCLFQTNILLSPMIVILIVFSSVISAPMLALFTLPLFFIAYPRPTKFWPGPPGLQANSSQDSVYYQQMASSMMNSFHEASRSGVFGTLHPGNHYLLRHDDRIAWIQVG